jgi:hypothetical protein
MISHGGADFAKIGSDMSEQLPSVACDAMSAIEFAGGRPRQILKSAGRFSSQVTVSVYRGIFQLLPSRIRW